MSINVMLLKGFAVINQNPCAFISANSDTFIIYPGMAQKVVEVNFAMANRFDHLLVVFVGSKSIFSNNTELCAIA